MEAFGSLLPRTETSISRADTDFSTRIFIANSEARFKAGASSARECTFVIPTDEPSPAGFQKFLPDSLAHTTRRAKHAGTEEGKSREIEQTLDRSVFAVGAVHHGKND